MRYCGRDFSDDELAWIQKLLAEQPQLNRAQLSRALCRHLGWYKADGELKEMSCRVVMLRMHADGRIALPEPQNGNGNGRGYTRRTQATDPDLPIDLPVEQFCDLRLDPVADRRTSHLWNEYIQRYHYLGYQPLPGAQMRYLATAQGRVLALLGFGAAAWKVAPRDLWIGWSAAQRRERLHLIINNARFLILPWISCRNLASKLLAMAARRIQNDWTNRYGYRPVLLETFVESQRFTGTCYRAANWTYVGQTQGRGKLDSNHQAQLPVKDIWLYPLEKRFKTSLCS